MNGDFFPKQDFCGRKNDTKIICEQVKSFDSERRKLESRIEKLTKQIAVLEKAVEDNRSEMMMVNLENYGSGGGFIRQ